MARKIRQYLTNKHDQWLEEGSEECSLFGMTWYATWRWYACRALAPIIIT